MTKKISHLIAGVSLSALVLAGCSPDNESDSSNSESTSAASSTAETSKSTAAADKDLTFEDAVVRAASVHGAERLSPLLTQRRVIDLGRRAAGGCPRR